ncbi:MAG: WD40 repeat domain-containing protein, partial [Novipirellula sp. JB048]
ITAKQAEKVAADAEVAQLQADLDAAKKRAAAAKALSEKSTKDLVAQNKAVTDAEAAKTKSEDEVAKRQQVFASSTSAQQFAAASIPAHLAIVAAETRRGEVLSKAAAAILARGNAASNGVIDVDFQGDTLATAHRDGSLRWYDAATGHPLGAHEGVGHAHLIIVGDQLVGFSSRSSASLVPMKTRWQLEHTIGATDSDLFADRVTALDFRRDGLTLAVGGGAPSRGGEVKIFDVRRGTLLRDFGSVHSDTVLALDFSPDGTTLASASADKTIRLLDIATQTQIRTLEGHTHHVLAVAWKQDGERIVSASADQTLKAWDAQTGQSTRTVSGFPKEISALDFIQATDQVAAAGAHGEVRLVNTSNGAIVRRFNAANDFLYTARVTSDGGKVLASGQNGHLRIWNLADGKLIGELP